MRSAPGSEKTSAGPPWNVTTQFSCQPPTIRRTTGLADPNNFFPGPNGNSYNPWRTSRCGRSEFEITFSGFESLAFRYEVASRNLESVYEAPKYSPADIR